MYREAHAKIRANPSQEKKQPREGIVVKRYVSLWSRVASCCSEANDEPVIATLNCL